MLLEEWLDDLCIRFITNLPVEELSSAARICFQIEESQWFYEDFVRPLDPELPALNLRQFSAVMFEHCPLLSGFTLEEQERAFQAFLQYKTMVPVRGAIMLNDDMDEVVLVKGWKKSASWSFPRGKIDQNELDLTCAIREVYEETGYDLRASGLVGREEDMKSIEIQIRGQDLMMFVFRGVPMDTHFMPRTRKEISKVQWHRIADLPMVKSKKHQHEGHGDGLITNTNKFYMVAPFLGPLKKWIAQQRRHAKSLSANTSKMVASLPAENLHLVSDQEQVEDQIGENAQNDHLSRLLQTLRQSSQVVGSDLPEVSERHQDVRSTVRSQDNKSAELKALLFGGELKKSTQHHASVNQPFPHPNMAHPPMQAHPYMSNDLSTPLNFVTTPQPPQGYPAPSANFLKPKVSPIQEPQLRPIPPPSHPAMLAPRQEAQHTSDSIRDKIFPSLQVVDSKSPNLNMARDALSLAAPHPGQIPTPKLNTQKSALLNLFKTPKPIPAREQRPTTQNFAAAPELASESVTAKSFAPREQPPALDVSRVPNDNSFKGTAAIHPPMQFADSKHVGNRAQSNAPSMFVPSQVSQFPSEKASTTSRRPTAHQSKLLGMFKAPTPKPKEEELEPPKPAIELSASPRGHRSPNPSGTVPPNVAARPPSKGATLGQIKIQKRPQQDEEPVSATVSGPLNSPQFDMIRTPSQEKREPTLIEKPKKVSPVRILARPASSHTAPNNSTQVPPPSKIHPKTSLTKVQQPPAPDLKARDVPPKAFQPTILRRPGTSQDISVPSPIEPLPSPKHKTIKSRDTPTPAADHKKSLLSLFTKPSGESPVISPPSVAPLAQAGDISAVISPLEKPFSSPTVNSNNFLSNGFHPASIAAAFGAPSAPKTQAPARKPEQTRKQYYAPDRMPQQFNQTTQTANVEDASRDSGRHMSNASQTSTITPANEQMLLGFLNGLK